MTTQYTPSLRLALPGTGDLDGLWGEVVNNQITELVEQALTGSTTITTWTSNSHTLTSIDGTVDEARAAVIVAQTGDGTNSSPFTLIAPAQAKTYILSNVTGNTLEFKSSAVGANTLSIPSGHNVWVACDGTVSRFGISFAQNFHSAGVDVVDGTTTQSYVSLSPGPSHSLNAAVANFYYLPSTGGGSISVSLSPTGNSGLSGNVSFLALLVNPGTGSISWPGTVKWPNNTAPIINSNTFNLFLFTQYSGTSFWYGAVLNNYAPF